MDRNEIEMDKHARFLNSARKIKEGLISSSCE